MSHLKKVTSELWRTKQVIQARSSAVSSQFLTFLMLWPFNTALILWWPTTVKILLLHNCNIAVMNHKYLILDPRERVVWPQRGHDPQQENHFSRAVHCQSCIWLCNSLWSHHNIHSFWFVCHSACVEVGGQLSGVVFFFFFHDMSVTGTKLLSLAARVFMRSYLYQPCPHCLSKNC